MIIAGTRPSDPAEVARELRARLARADEVGEPRSGEDPTGVERGAAPRAGEAADPPAN